MERNEWAIALTGAALVACMFVDRVSSQTLKEGCTEYTEECKVEEATYQGPDRKEAHESPGDEVDDDRDASKDDKTDRQQRKAERKERRKQRRAKKAAQPKPVNPAEVKPEPAVEPSEPVTFTPSQPYDRDNWDYNSRAARERLNCDSSEHVDHVVALKEAYDSGAHLWSNERKEVFANDPLNQWCLEAGVNISKRDYDLAEWSKGTCQQRKHIARVTRLVKAKYDLETDLAEAQANIEALLAPC